MASCPIFPGGVRPTRVHIVYAVQFLLILVGIQNLPVYCLPADFLPPCVERKLHPHVVCKGQWPQHLAFVCAGRGCVPVYMGRVFPVPAVD